MMTNEVTININMFSTFMEDIIMSNLNSTSIKFSCSGIKEKFIRNDKLTHLKIIFIRYEKLRTN